MSHASAARETRAGTTCEEAGARVRVLLVEDSPAEADLTRGFLALARSLRFDVTRVDSLGEALKRLARRGIDVVLLDLNLPDSDGLPTALKARAAAPDVPIIVLTGMEDRAAAVQAVHEGAQDYLFKPDVDSTHLERSIRYALERQRLMSELSRKYQKELELGQLKTRLVSMVSHEFANALSVIECALPFLAEDGGRRSAKWKRVYGSIEGSVRSLHVTAHNLLNLGRMESGRLALNPRRTDAGGLVRESLAGLEVLRRRRAIRAALEVPDDPLYVKADPELLSLVVSNLLSNAIKYTPARGRIAVGARPDAARPDRVVLFVQDTGIGIPRAERRKIFAAYYRTEAAQKTALGYGVGLAFAKTVLEAHGTSLKVESAPGKGSRFSFALPLWAEDEAPAPSGVTRS